jgi:hypothetical protein
MCVSNEVTHCRDSQGWGRFDPVALVTPQRLAAMVRTWDMTTLTAVTMLRGRKRRPQEQRGQQTYSRKLCA